MSDKHHDAARVVAIVSLAFCLGVVVLAAGVFIMAASKEAKEFLGYVGASVAIVLFIATLAWGSAKAMRAS